METIYALFAKLNSLDDLIRWGGYLVLIAIVFAETGLLVGFFLPGDSLLITAGLFAGKGDLNIWILFPVLTIVAIIGDAVGYWIGRKAGPRLFNREKSLFFAKDHLLAAKRFYEKYGSKAIVLARFMPIVRTFAPVVAGVGEMPYTRFATYNVIGAFLWIGSMLSIGYFLGQRVPDIDEKIHFIIAGIIVVSLLPPVIELLRHRASR